MQRYKKLQELTQSLGPEIENFYEKKNKTTGTRARVLRQEIKLAVQAIRQEIQETKNKFVANKMNSA